MKKPYVPPAMEVTELQQFSVIVTSKDLFEGEEI